MKSQRDAGRHRESRTRACAGKGRERPPVLGRAAARLETALLLTLDAMDILARIQLAGQGSEELSSARTALMVSEHWIPRAQRKAR